MHTKKLVEVLHEERVRCCLVDRKHVLSAHSFAATDLVAVDTDAAAEAAVVKAMQKDSPLQFIWTQFQDLGRFYFQRYAFFYQIAEIRHTSKPMYKLLCSVAGRSKHKQGETKIGTGAETDFSQEKCMEIVESLDRRIGNVFKSCRENTMMMVVTGQGDTMAAMVKQVVGMIIRLFVLWYQASSRLVDGSFTGRKNETTTGAGASMDQRGRARLEQNISEGYSGSVFCQSEGN